MTSSPLAISFRAPHPPAPAKELPFLHSLCLAGFTARGEDYICGKRWWLKLESGQFIHVCIVEGRSVRIFVTESYHEEPEEEWRLPLHQKTHSEFLRILTQLGARGL